MRRQIVDRLFLCGITYAVVSIALFETASLSHMVVEQGGWPAKLGMLALGLANTVALIDTVVNDCLPARWTLHRAMRWRQGVWLFIGITYAGHVFVILRSEMGYLVGTFYALYALRCSAVSFLDLRYQYQEVVAKAKGEPVPTDYGVLDV